MKSIYEIRKIAVSPKGKEYQEKLDNLNWDMQELQFKLSEKSKVYNELLREYKLFLGYEEKDLKDDKSI